MDPRAIVERLLQFTIVEDCADLQRVLDLPASRQFVVDHPFVLYRSGPSRRALAQALGDSLNQNIDQLPEDLTVDWASLQSFTLAQPNRQSRLYDGALSVMIRRKHPQVA